ncbi:hypothetical protein BURPS1710A_A0980 [Burkholderia pseudomallei 1710a]|uniref:Uncharacterized protein n=1 Tax=Burkholderia pseudomallei 1710a TaxID=320371 RepID=A0A0E1VQI9_BURPE|nr:hypothetical protein BURPS1710A_A0980 [Burkholderia pseudomallei 1710a]
MIRARLAGFEPPAADALAAHAAPRASSGTSVPSEARPPPETPRAAQAPHLRISHRNNPDRWQQTTERRHAGIAAIHYHRRSRCPRA